MIHSIGLCFRLISVHYCLESRQNFGEFNLAALRFNAKPFDAPKVRYS